MRKRSLNFPPDATLAEQATDTDARPLKRGRIRRRFRGWRSSRLKFFNHPGLTLLEGGHSYFPALIARIDEARDSVRLETYMFCDDESAQAVAEALQRAAARGVDVRVITDGVGTARLSLFEQWPEQNIQHRIFNPHIFGAAGIARDHRKVCAIDQRVAYCGGINIIDDLINEGRRMEAPRWDFAVEMLGPVVKDVILAFDAQWERVGLADQGKARWPSRWLPWRPDRKRIREALRQDLILQPPRRGEPGLANAAPGGEPQVAFVARDNRLNRRAIERAYLYAIGRSTHHILLANPYFTPGRRLRRALTAAAKRGVDVQLLIGRKEFKLLDWAVPSLYGNLMKSGVRIAEYDKALLHGKVAVIDDEWATVGSSNLDALSLFLNHEANVVIVRDPCIADLRDSINHAFTSSHQIDQGHYAARGWPERLLNWSAYALYRLTMRVLTIGRFD